MTGLNLLGGVLVILTLGITAANADSYYGPRQVGDQCYRRSGAGESVGYWEKCATNETTSAATGRTSNAKTGRTSNAATGRTTTNAADGGNRR